MDIEAEIIKAYKKAALEFIDETKGAKPNASFGLLLTHIDKRVTNQDVINWLADK